MPFQGNKWDSSKSVSAKDILTKANEYYGEQNISKAIDSLNDTSRKYNVNGFMGNFGMISTVSNPFCDTCNRIRLTANGRIKNCLFSGGETNLLQALRNGEDILPIITETVFDKKKQRGGIDDFSSESGQKMSQKNRSMIMIGG